MPAPILLRGELLVVVRRAALGALILLALSAALPTVARATINVLPTADGYAIAGRPRARHWGADLLWAGGRPRARARLTFAGRSLARPRRGLRLRLYCVTGAPRGLSVRRARGWRAGGLLARSGRVRAGRWVTVELRGTLHATRRLSVLVTAPQARRVAFASRERPGRAPRLLVDEVVGPGPEGGPTSGGGTGTTGPGPAPAPGGAADVQPAFPIRAAFYYPWFPEAWNQRGLDPFTHYTPSSGFYDGSDPATIARQVSDLRFAGVDAAIASWWGVGSRTDGRIRSLLDVTAASGSPLRWTLYYERESTGDPSPAEIASDLAWIDAAYAHHVAYLRVRGRPVIFVYAAPGDGCDMAARWAAANTLGFYVVLKVFPGYRTCSSQPDSWHQYAPAIAADEQPGYSYAISPGFFQADEAVPRLARDIDRFRGGVRDMVASGAPWQLVTTYNEWGEGTAVESAAEWSSGDGRGLYLDALHGDGAAP